MDIIFKKMDFLTIKKSPDRPKAKLGLVLVMKLDTYNPFQ